MRPRQNRSIRLFAHRSVNGLTLIELMTALTISSLVMAALLEMYLTNQRSYKAQIALSEIQNHAHSVIAFLKSDIRKKMIGTNIYSIEPTQQKNDDGSIIYAMYRRNMTTQRKMKLANNITQLTMRYTMYDEGEWLEVRAQDVNDWSKVKGVAIEFDVRSSATALKKHWYAYVSLP